MGQLLEAAPIIQQTLPELSRRVQALKTRGLNPRLVVILVGSNPASLTYVKNKQKLCESVGATSELIQLPDDVTKDKLKAIIEELNLDHQVGGILLQLPLPKHLDDQNIEHLICSSKDVDGLSLINLGALMLNRILPQHFIPCTPKGILKLLSFYKYNLEGKKVCIIGRSQIVGRPMALLATRNNATVTLCHSKTKNLQAEARNSDVLISAVGSANFIDKEFCHPQQVIIDVGINRTQQGTLCGDVKFQEVFEYVKAITPVPGGVGRLTVLSLVENLIMAYENKLHGDNR